MDTASPDLINSILIYPTDTVWGIGANAYDSQSQELIRKIKKNDQRKPLSVLFSQLDHFLSVVHLPSYLSRSWLAEFFPLQASLAFPKLWLRDKRLGEHITADSDLFSARCVEHPALKKMIDKIGAPVTSTSLNLQGAPPIIDEKEAYDFHQQYCPSSQFYTSSEGPFPSGKSSTILCLQESPQEFLFLREGLNSESIRSHAKLLST